MSVYLYNLGFSVSNAAQGSFSSSGWYKYNGSGSLPVTTGLSVMSSVLPISNWAPAAPAGFNSGQMGNPDYILLRIFNSDNTPASYRVKTIAIFGQGDSAAPPPTNSPVQSPFLNGSYPLPLIDCDVAAVPPPSVPNWPLPVTDAQQGQNASWAYCLGAVQGYTCSYVFNVGIAVYVLSSGASFTFGIDPRMKVNGMSMLASKRADDAA